MKIHRLADERYRIRRDAGARASLSLAMIFLVPITTYMIFVSYLIGNIAEYVPPLWGYAQPQRRQWILLVLVLKLLVQCETTNINHETR